MTTYSFKVTLDDCEMIAIKAALDLYIEHCRAQQQDGAKAPFWAHERSCINVRNRLHADPMLTSTNNFLDGWKRLADKE